MRRAVIMCKNEVHLRELIETVSQVPQIKIVATISDCANCRKVTASQDVDIIFIGEEFDEISADEADIMKKIMQNSDLKLVVKVNEGGHLLRLVSDPDKVTLLHNFSPQEISKSLATKTTAKQALSVTNVQNRGKNRPLITLTITNDILILKPENIGYFQFNSRRKLWEAVSDLSNSTVTLKKGTNAETILSFGSCFLQVHQSYIININHLQLIHNNRCVMVPPFNSGEMPIVSRYYKKKLQEECIEI